MAPLNTLTLASSAALTGKQMRDAAPTNFDNLPSSGFMRQPQVLEVVPFSSATLWRKVKNGTFPAPVKLSERVTAWKCGAVRQFLATQAAPAEDV